MKAIFYSKYGAPDQLQLKEVEKPTPGDNEVLVEIHAATVTVGDVYTVKGEPFLTRFWTGLLQPKNRIPGKEMAGRVEAVGANVTQFQPGDEVFGDLSGCGLGALAEYVAVPEDAIALKPANLTFEEAAAVPESALVARQDADGNTAMPNSRPPSISLQTLTAHISLASRRGSFRRGSQ